MNNSEKFKASSVRLLIKVSFPQRLKRLSEHMCSDMHRAALLLLLMARCHKAPHETIFLW